MAVMTDDWCFAASGYHRSDPQRFCVTIRGDHFEQLPHNVRCTGTAPRATATTGSVAPLAALLPHTCQVLRVVWHTGYRGKQQGEEGGGFFRVGMVETPEEPGAPASTRLATWAAPLVHSMQREQEKLALEFRPKTIIVFRP
jgi:hypothetical protein